VRFNDYESQEKYDQIGPESRARNLLLANQAAWAWASRLSSGSPGRARFGKGAPGIGLFKIEFIRHKKRALEGLVLWVTEAFGSFFGPWRSFESLGTTSEGFCAVLEWVMVLEPCSVATGASSGSGPRSLSAVTQNQPLKVEIKGFKTSHCLE
jgi:hypothetical protein